MAARSHHHHHRISALMLTALVTAGCTTGHATSASAPTSPSAALPKSAASSTFPTVPDAGAKVDAQHACAPAATLPRTLADVAANYARQSAAAAQAARLDSRWKDLAMATSAMANSWQALQGYPTKPKHPLALNLSAMSAFQKQEYHRRYTIATDVYPTILVQCRKATG